MYALPNKTQHKLIVKVRGGISQKLDNFTSSTQSSSSSGSNNSSNQSSLLASKESSLSRRHIDETGFDAELSHLPQPVFRSLNQNGNKQKSHYHRAQKQFISPEHNEMIKYVQQSWRGVERDYKKSVNSFINNIDFNSTTTDHPTAASSRLEQKEVVTKKKTATTSTPLLLSGSYHHITVGGKEFSSGKQDSNSGRQDSFKPFDLEAFWGNRILKRLTGDI